LQFPPSYSFKSKFINFMTIFVRGSRKDTKNPNEYNEPLERDLNLGPLEYEAQLLRLDL
jgi:hypothetical protein